MDVGPTPGWGHLLVVGLKSAKGLDVELCPCVGTVEVVCAFVVLISSKSACAALRAWQPQLYLQKVPFKFSNMLA